MRATPATRIEAKNVIGVNENVRKRAEIVFLLSLAIVALYLCYLIARPFLGALLTAVMLAVVFYPVHSRVLRVFHRSTIAAALSTTLVCLIGIVPIVIVSIFVRDEVCASVLSLREQNVVHTSLGGYFARLGEILHRFDKYVDFSQLDPYAAILRWVEQVSRYLLTSSAALVANLFSFALNAIVVFVCLFFFFREGRRIRQRLAAMLPLRVGQTERLFEAIREAMAGNLYGAFAVGVSQGILTGLSFWVLGLAAPLLWAVATMGASLLPVVGSALVWGPASLVLLLSGHWVKALVLLCWGALVVGQVDAVVRPAVVGAHVKTHPLLVFFALFGGVKVFGIIGIFVGPVILSFGIAVLELLGATGFSWHSTSEPVLVSK
jgi:predicted PurR-regulated permease PerM